MANATKLADQPNVEDVPAQYRGHGRQRSRAMKPQGRVVGAFGVAAGFSVLAVVIFAWVQPLEGSVAQSPMPVSNLRSITVQPQPVTLDLSLIGKIGAGATVSVLVPFDGVVMEKIAQIGQSVTAGEALATIDTAELEGKYRNIQVAVIKAEMAANALKNWQTSAEVVRARQNLVSAEITLADTQQQVLETEALFEKGIVSRNEKAGLLRQRDRQLVSVESYRQDLDFALARGSFDNQRLAALDLETARASLLVLEGQLAKSVIVAPTSGIVTGAHQSSTPSQNPIAIEPGSPVLRGQEIFVIADTSRFEVTAMIDEIDIRHVYVGQSALVSSDAMSGPSVMGTISRVSSEARPADAGQSGVVFEVQVQFQPAGEDQRRGIRLGMSAKLDIEIYSNPQAIVVPIAGVTGGIAAPRVRVFANGTGEIHSVPVVIGVTTKDGVEIRSGVEAGDQIVLP